MLIRYLTWDDDFQSPLAANASEGAETVLVSSIVLYETVETDRPLAEAGLAALRGNGDFADGVILFEAERARVDAMVTFDNQFAKHANARRLRFLVS